MSEVSPLFQTLVAKYATADILHPHLKAVTIAQWMLESARGTSRLATEHFNFAGMKFRPEMSGVATSVSHTTTHDGTAKYCRFASLENFIKGFWVFMGRSPYDGWEDHAATGESFIKFIGPIWAPAAASPSNPGYAKKVIVLLPEATALLTAAGGEAPDDEVDNDITEEPIFTDEKKFVVVLDPGHGGTADLGGSSHNNATANPSKIKEKAMTLDLAQLVEASLKKASASDPDAQVEVFLTRTGDNNLGLSARANVARSKKASIFLSLHFNGFNKIANGVETLVMPAHRNVNLAEDRALAKRINDAVLIALRKHRPETKDRGVKEQSLGVLNDVELGNSSSSHRCRACLLEGEFIDVPAVDALLNTGPKAKAVRQDMANAIASAIIADLKAQG